MTRRQAERAGVSPATLQRLASESVLERVAQGVYHLTGAPTPDHLALRATWLPAAFRRALTDKLRAKAETSRWTLPQLQRQMAYDRLLERLYLVDEGWVVKGATALLARDIGVRATIDIDVYREAARDVAEAELRAAAAKDIGDWFAFEIGAARSVADAAAGIRLPVTAYIGTTVSVSFNVDLVGSDLRMTGEPEAVPPLARIVMPDVEQRGYRLTHSLITLPTRSRRCSSSTARRARRRPASRISWTSSPSSSAPPWTRDRRR